MSTSFIDIKRREPQYRENRTGDFRDVEVRPSLDEIRAQVSRCMNCGVPFCHAYGCPLGNMIPDANQAVLEGRMKDAYKIFSRTSPFPEFTSRVCPALCESACCANLASGAVTIKQIEYAVIENAFEMGYVNENPPAFKSGSRVAVIGSGPAGLALADALNKMGHEVAVFEKSASAGGLLRCGIPDFKLEKWVVQRRVEVLKKRGVMFELGVEIGRDISANYLRRKFDALCVCAGTQVPRDLKIAGRELGGIHFALEFLGSQNRANSGESSELEISAKDKNVLIIGGGDTGSDCLGTAIRQGAKKVVQIEIMPEPPAERHSSTPWPMWEYKKRTSSSHKEGGERLWSVMSQAFEGVDGKVKSLKASLCDWEFSKDGRPLKPALREGSAFEIEADLVLISMGFTGVKKEGLVSELGLELTERGMIKVGPNFETSRQGVFACGDSINGPSLVVRAAASALDAAKSIDKYLKSKV